MTPEQDKEAWARSDDLALYAVLLIMITTESMIDGMALISTFILELFT